MKKDKEINQVTKLNVQFVSKDGRIKEIKNIGSVSNGDETTLRIMVSKSLFDSLCNK